MTQSKKFLAIWLFVLALTVPQAAFAVDAFEDPSVTTTTTTATDSTDAVAAETWKPQESQGKTMEEFVTEANAGFPDKFTDGEVMSVMSASRKLRDSDRELSRKLERIGSKMSSI